MKERQSQKQQEINKKEKITKRLQSINLLNSNWLLKLCFYFWLVVLFSAYPHFSCPDMMSSGQQCNEQVSCRLSALSLSLWLFITLKIWAEVNRMDLSQLVQKKKKSSSDFNWFKPVWQIAYKIFIYLEQSVCI